uniref:Uncharacterized protein n=1 Tax=Lactuca sativa TaxID=4236 RepID=A0A9R1V9P5_LACSA|nr:hypothetical protein LSAT_V11C600309970 [Lactuca sativa]
MTSFESVKRVHTYSYKQEQPNKVVQDLQLAPLFKSGGDADVVCVVVAGEGGDELVVDGGDEQEEVADSGDELEEVADSGDELGEVAEGRYEQEEGDDDEEVEEDGGGCEVAVVGGGVLVYASLSSCFCFWGLCKGVEYKTKKKLWSI